MSIYNLQMSVDGINDLVLKEVTIKDLRSIKEEAISDFKSRAKPYALESDEFITLCYTRAVINNFTKSGILSKDIDIGFKDIYTNTQIKG